jgi:hypothetical protein
MIRSRAAFAALGALALATAPALADSWKIDTSHSSVSFSVTHMMVSTVRGNIGGLDGTLEYDGKDASSIKVDASVDANAITTNNEKRDAHLKTEDFFDVANNPKITFKSKKATAGTKPGHLHAHGRPHDPRDHEGSHLRRHGPVADRQGDARRVARGCLGHREDQPPRLRDQVEPRARRRWGRRGRREQRGLHHDRHRGPSASRESSGAARAQALDRATT